MINVAAKELENEATTQEIYERIYDIVLKIDRVAEARRKHLASSPPDEAILVCLSQIKKNLMGVLMSLNIHLNTCFSDGALCNKKLYSHNNKMSHDLNLYEYQFEPINFYLKHGTLVFLHFHLDILFSTILFSIAPECKDKDKINFSGALKKILRSAIGNEQERSCYKNNLWKLTTIRNSFHNNGLDKQSQKITIYTTEEFIQMIGKSIDLIDRICLHESIKHKIIKDEAASQVSSKQYLNAAEIHQI